MYRGTVNEIRNDILDTFTSTSEERTQLLNLLGDLERYAEQAGVMTGRGQIIDQVNLLTR